MQLYTRANADVGQPVSRHTLPDDFDGKKLTIFYIHGWMNTEESEWMPDVKKETLIRGDYNVVIVGWRKGSLNPLYPQSASDTRSVGTEVALTAALMQTRGGLSRADLYCVGHSLGAHVCGHAGMKTKFGRITGMDPAGPFFEDRDILVGLNPTSADLVDVMHTNGHSGLVPGLGTVRPLGHVDFYPNGGEEQPSCLLDPDVACSHGRAVAYFIESINSPCFNAYYQCTGDVEAIPGSCQKSDKPLQTMGFDSNLFSNQGVFYLTTNGASPYCRN
jgi:hypothetical protein